MQIAHRSQTSSVHVQRTFSTYVKHQKFLQLYQHQQHFCASRKLVIQSLPHSRKTSAVDARSQTLRTNQTVGVEHSQSFHGMPPEKRLHGMVPPSSEGLLFFIMLQPACPPRQPPPPPPTSSPMGSSRASPRPLPGTTRTVPSAASKRRRELKQPWPAKHGRRRSGWGEIRHIGSCFHFRYPLHEWVG